MDAKTAVLWLRPGRHRMEHYQDDANNVADFVEQQEMVIAGLMQIIDSQKQTNLAIIKKYQEQEKFAELGRLAMRVEVCWHNYKINDGDCHGEKCSRYNFCKKRAETLVEEKL